MDEKFEFHKESGSTENWDVDGNLLDSPKADAATLDVAEDTHTFTKFPDSAVDVEEEDAEDTSQLIGDPNKHPVWSFAYYQALFNVDTSTVIKRIKGSMIPLPSSNFNKSYIGGRPDMYGPVWICATLVLVIGVCGNLTTLFNHLGDENYHYTPQFRRLTIAGLIVYSYAFIVPLLIKGIFWWRQTTSGFSVTGIICTYGYSLFVFIPAAVLLLVPFNVFDWIVITLAAVLSGSVISFSLWPAFRDDSRKIGYIVMVGLFFLHIVLSVTIKLLFFTPISIMNVSNSTLTSTTTVSTTTNTS